MTTASNVKSVGVQLAVVLAVSSATTIQRLRPRPTVLLLIVIRSVVVSALFHPPPSACSLLGQTATENADWRPVRFQWSTADKRAAGNDQPASLQRMGAAMRPPSLIDVLLAELASDPTACEALADALAETLGHRLTSPTELQPDAWLDSLDAAAYLGISRNALHKHTATRSIPFEQDGPGCRCWFKRSDLDEWRTGTAAKTHPGAPTRKLQAAIRA